MLSLYETKDGSFVKADGSHPTKEELNQVVQIRCHNDLLMGTLTMEQKRNVIINYLNRCLKADPLMMLALTEQVIVNNISDENPIFATIGDPVTTSAIGLLNGVLDILNIKPIFIVFTEDKTIRFE